MRPAPVRTRVDASRCAAPARLRSAAPTPAASRGCHSDERRATPRRVRAYSEAIGFYSADACPPKLLSNRAAAHSARGDHPAALDDASRAVALDRTWSKAHCRRGTALHGLGRLDEAISAYSEALRLEPGNGVASQGLENVRRMLKAGS